MCVFTPLCSLYLISYFTHNSSSIAFLWVRCDREGSFGVMCCYRARLHHVKVAGITAQMPHNGASDRCSIHLCQGQLGITRSFTTNIHRDHFGIKNEDYSSEYGFIFSPLCVCHCVEDKGSEATLLFSACTTSMWRYVMQNKAKTRCSNCDQTSVINQV